MIIKIQNSDKGLGNYRVRDEDDCNNARLAISRTIKGDAPMAHLIVSIHNPAYYRRFDGFKGYAGVTITT